MQDLLIKLFNILNLINTCMKNLFKLFMEPELQAIYKTFTTWIYYSL